MDNENLRKLLVNSDEKQFWIKPWGNPDRPPEEEERFYDALNLTVGFAKQPNAVQIGDILIVHRIVYAKVMLFAEVTSLPNQATDEEKKKDPLRERWTWGVEATNLTPTYGTHWFEHSIKTFALAKKFNEENPAEKFSLGSINFGNDKLKIPQRFAEVIINEIMNLKEN